MRAGSKVCGHGNNARGNDSPYVVCVCLCVYFFHYLFFYFFACVYVRDSIKCIRIHMSIWS